ncbi:sodium bile acid symporter family-domain-containing protein [Halteromyces radiatus]|uniref:sodium bile acid symporter family-domain-containing protein n=1 Tax=Halteromyces radiatus TaxID=101107 RepID=UPI00221F8BE3|nr:sodium bile acid symporter family-domain-containing protein [Halteromyces radiatus]KAI8086456.1 sodium bile acid symporter family-domain-containing protein [Halteromyces radiatus]
MPKLSFVDKFLPVWILGCMILGVLLGVYVPSVKEKLNTVTLADVSLPTAIGLLWMMYPVLCKVRYEALVIILKEKDIKRQIMISLIINWIIAPLFMTAIAWATLPDLPEYRSGVILVGTARCIAMVLIWNNLAGGDIEYCAILVAINSLLQIGLYGPLSYFYVVIVGHGSDVGINMWIVVRSVLVFLGIPLLAAVITRLTLRRVFGKQWYDNKFLPTIGFTSLLGLLFVIVVMFSSQGYEIVHDIGNVFRVMVPLVVYFAIIFFATLYLCHYLCIPYPTAVTQCFTAASNNFELAIAVAVGSYGIDSKEALAATIGPLIEVPVLVALVYVIMSLRTKWYEKKIVQCEDEKCKASAISTPVDLPN